MYAEREGDTQSPLERRFLEDCVTVGLRIEPQFSVENIHADFAIPEMHLVIECDGEEWHGNEDAGVADAHRNRIYARNGYAVLRLIGADIFRGGEALAEYIKLAVQRDEFETGHLYKIYANKEGWGAEPTIELVTRRIITDL
jgi:very-short-patch-repair endonuclease